ncbi:MAG: glycerophosphodiester phosphodiesterase [Eubacteriales bacterium]|nr:glycerophosphodiester phosphodiesterase [Eubacteriales bacterium]
MQCIYGHRGASGYAPENTLEAFELAAKMGAAGVELDTHITRDGEVVVTHDERIDRVSSGSGLVKDYTLKELKGFKFNKTHPEYVNATIPTLREVYELLAPLGLSVNVELKNSCIFYPQLEEKCIEIAAQCGMTDRVLYSSFNHYSLMHVKEIAPELPCGLLYDATLYHAWEYAHRLGVNALHPKYTELLIADECEKAHALGLEVNPWTVNDEDTLRMVISAGADRIITNFPDRALAMLKAK